MCGVSVTSSMQTQQPILVIAPLSTLGFWRREIESWTSLNVIMYHDKQIPEGVDHEVYKFDVLLTTYEITIADMEELMPVVVAVSSHA